MTSVMVTVDVVLICQTGNMRRFFCDLEVFGLVVACYCHDLDHRGTNNAFQTKYECKQYGA